MNLGAFDAPLTQLFDQPVEIAERLYLLLFIDQKIAGARAFLEQHYPLPGIRRVDDDMSIEEQAFGLLDPYFLK